MATVINNPNAADSETGGWSVAIIILAIIVLGVLAFFAFGHGSLGGGTSTTQVNIPASGGGAPSGSGGGASGGASGGVSGGASAGGSAGASTGY